MRYRSLLALAALLLSAGAAHAQTWYLMLPPEQLGRRDDVAKDPLSETPPLSQWFRYRSFDRPADCEHARSEEQADALQLLTKSIRQLADERRNDLRQATQRRIDDASSFLDRVTFGHCVAATDPRLAPSRDGPRAGEPR